MDPAGGTWPEVRQALLICKLYMLKMLRAVFHRTLFHEVHNPSPNLNTPLILDIHNVELL